METATQATAVERKNLPYRFTTDETIALAKKAAEEQSRLKALEEGKKMVADEWKAKISACQAEITNLSNKITSGIEYRDYNCIVTFDDPKRDYKTLRHPATGEIVEIKEMTFSEINKRDQAELPLEDGKLEEAESEAASAEEKPWIVEEEEQAGERPEALEEEPPEKEAPKPKKKASKALF